VFTNNFIQKPSNFPNLRHNIYVTGGSVVTVANLNPDTGTSNFIYIADEGTLGGSIVSGVTIPLFIPRISSATPNELSLGISTQFVIKGDNFYPCGLNIAVYKNDQNNQIVV
jgi:hypothetical protein